ncbi:hypothetical protein EVAR_59203_1 [Eumeta japonica]|uniref:Uncharacterized protein n=1 Tax=Eumeta variegata TaxID=151549 RepID=A0A4C1ZK62_EUMVA|nr:hypothetical protein EVAR_59203_1 [Eumeta japonica]
MPPYVNLPRSSKSQNPPLGSPTIVCGRCLSCTRTHRPMGGREIARSRSRSHARLRWNATMSRAFQTEYFVDESLPTSVTIGPRRSGGAGGGMWSRKQSVCSALSGVSRADDPAPLYPFAVALRVRVLQIVCGISGLVVGAVGWLEERRRPALGLGVPAGALTVVAAGFERGDRIKKFRNENKTYRLPCSSA